MGSKEVQDDSSEVVYKVGLKNGSVTFPQINGKYQHGEESAKEQTFKEALVEFTQTTTIHGVKEITEEQPFRSRRLIWILLVLAGFGAFCHQLVVSILVYLSYPSTVSIKINYNHTLDFPAFTVCNHNSFRMTKVAEMGDYALISKVYEAEDTDIDWSKEQHANLSMGTLYRRTAHDMEDLIVNCTWDGKPCSLDDFQPLPTDYGLCYSFNKNPDPKNRKKAVLTGAEGGLRLLLNIEQYEYMPGPNSAAGLKISLHDPKESSSVKDHGYAIPPGSHTLVAVKILETENLEHPHGKCDSNINLVHFDRYSMHNCKEECDIDHQLEECGCLSIHMPKLAREKGYPICTLQEDYECVHNRRHGVCENSTGNCSSTGNVHNVIEKRCLYCPAPCNLLTYDATISYSSLSNFDLEALLDNDVADSLQSKNIFAREISEKVDETKFTTNTRLIMNLKASFDYLTSAFEAIRQELHAALNEAEAVYRQTLSHIQFHHNWGLYKVSYVQKYNFARSYDLRKERYFDYVCADFYSLRERTDFIFQSFMNETEESVIRSAWVSFESYIAGRQWLANKCKDQLLEVNASYYSGEPLLMYKSSIDRRYDMSWVSLNLLQANSDIQFRYVQASVDAFDDLDNSLSQARKIGNELVKNHTYDAEAFDAAFDQLESACRAINYRLFLLVDRVVYHPVSLADEIEEDFLSANDTLLVRQEELRWTKNNIIGLLDVIESSLWPKVDSIVTNSVEFLNDVDRRKNPVAKYIVSDEVSFMVQSLETVFSDLRSRSRELSDNWEYLTLSATDIWEQMLNEETTKNFYKMIYDDFQEYVAVPSTEAEYIRIFASLLDANETELRMSYPNWALEDRLNANFHVMDASEKKIEVHANISRLIDATSVLDYLNEKDTLFLSQFNEYRDNLMDFLSGNIIDTKFFTDNFVRLDVFMQELSYEEIVQQPSYGITNFVGDVGGAMGLFMGGSLLTMIAVFDFLIHFLCKRAAQC